MQTLLATEVRANMSSFIDTVVREKPQAVRRNRDVIVATSQSHMKFLLEAYKLNFAYEQDEDGQFFGSLQEIDFIVADGASLEELRENLAYQLIEYSKDYTVDFQKYFAAPNTKIHAPYVLRVSLQDDVESVVALLHG
ncbi:hypothetical protein [Paenibacillus sp. YPG26]|uniref:hypothetical protein n=1 Tax=Paenibacillus sp. YPG26 TaxID=2878915 RepID=UPI002040E3F6|nr:hypothetical protein [Paenibacillus sp. YPG26]USB32484.1 hypothetical protein LDO05_14425 [Paenibacillus sp. YPG26]